MPTQEPAMQEGGFRSSLFGFDKNDVLAYVSGLSSEAQQKELEFEQRLRVAQNRAEELEAERDTAQQEAAQLKFQLADAVARAETAQRQAAEASTRSEAYERQKAAHSAALQQANEYQLTVQQLQKQNMDLHEQLSALQEQLKNARATIAKQNADAKQALEAVQAQAKAQAEREAQEAQEAQKQKEAQETAEAKSVGNVYDRARIEARRILEDARIAAENAQRRMDEEAASQKRRMAENARGIAAGVLVLRDRLDKVDEAIGAVSLELQSATNALYKALDDTQGDLKSLGLDLKDFAEGTPELDEPEQPVPQKAAAKPVQQYRPRRAAAKPPVRLRASSDSRTRRSVAQSLDDALNRVNTDRTTKK